MGNWSNNNNNNKKKTSLLYVVYYTIMAFLSRMGTEFPCAAFGVRCALSALPRVAPISRQTLANALVSRVDNALSVDATPNINARGTTAGFLVVWIA